MTECFNHENQRELTHLMLNFCGNNLNTRSNTLKTLRIPPF